jgi:hypothetical protein
MSREPYRQFPNLTGSGDNQPTFFFSRINFRLQSQQQSPYLFANDVSATTAKRLYRQISLQTLHQDRIGNAPGLHGS